MAIAAQQLFFLLNKEALLINNDGMFWSLRIVAYDLRFYAEKITVVFNVTSIAGSDYWTKSNCFRTPSLSLSMLMHYVESLSLGISR